MTGIPVRVLTIFIPLALLVAACGIPVTSSEEFIVEIPEVPLEVENFKVHIEIPDLAFLEEIPLRDSAIPESQVILSPGNVLSETRKLDEFNCVRFNGIGAGRISTGEDHSITIRADENLLPLVQTQVHDRVLTIGFQDGTFQPHQPFTLSYEVSLNDLECVTNAGAGEMEVQAISTDAMRIELLGTGNVRLEDIKADELDVHLNGVGSIYASGFTDMQNLSLSGAGSYNALELFSQHAIVDLSGVGDAVIQVSDTLAVDLSGVGSIRYTGDPQLMPHLTGLGSLIHE